MIKGVLFLVFEFELKNVEEVVVKDDDDADDEGKNGEEGGLSPIPESVSQDPPDVLNDSSMSLKCSESGI